MDHRRDFDLVERLVPLKAAFLGVHPPNRFRFGVLLHLLPHVGEYDPGNQPKKDQVRDAYE